MRRRRNVSARTRALRSRARVNRRAVIDALYEGKSFIVSNRTDVELNLVHHGLARDLVKYRYAQYPDDALRPGWRNMSMIEQRPVARRSRGE